MPALPITRLPRVPALALALIGLAACGESGRSPTASGPDADPPEAATTGDGLPAALLGTYDADADACAQGMTSGRLTVRTDTLDFFYGFAVVDEVSAHDGGYQVETTLYQTEGAVEVVPEPTSYRIERTADGLRIESAYAGASALVRCADAQTGVASGTAASRADVQARTPRPRTARRSARRRSRPGRRSSGAPATAASRSSSPKATSAPTSTRASRTARGTRPLGSSRSEDGRVASPRRAAIPRHRPVRGRGDGRDGGRAPVGPRRRHGGARGGTGLPRGLRARRRPAGPERGGPSARRPRRRGVTIATPTGAGDASWNLVPCARAYPGR